MKVSIGNDHAGTDYKLKIIEYLEKKNFKIKNHGTNKEESVDVMAKNFKQDRKVLEQSAEWTSYGDLTIKKDGYSKITDLVNDHNLFKAPAYKDFVDPTLYKEG